MKLKVSYVPYEWAFKEETWTPFLEQLYQLLLAQLYLISLWLTALHLPFLRHLIL
jgi:hypothetical protein